MMRVTIEYSDFIGGYCVGIIWSAWEREKAGEFLRQVLDPVNAPIPQPTRVVTLWRHGYLRILEENLPAAIAILRFNGIEVEVEK
jgi:hypothetical protein